MTITEAREKWGISPEKMLEMLSLGVIRNVRIENDVVTLPDYQGIRFPRKNQKITCQYIEKTILESCENLWYTDYCLLCVEETVFSTILKLLEENGYITKKVPTVEDYTSNENYICTDSGRTYLKKGKFTLSKVTAGVGFKFISFEATFKKK